MLGTVARRFASAHVNREHPVGASLSPCLNYVVCGSEDHHAHLYDARSGSPVAAVACGAETVTDAAFSPRHAQWAAASLDGRARFFAETSDD
jgi:WD40 repeat protein